VRIAFVGASEVSLATARALIKKGHEVVIVESDKAKIEELAGGLDCSFLQGDGSRPDILREVNPAGTDVLFCLTDNDPVNVIASLVGRSLGFKRVVTSIVDAQYEGICRELRLEDTIIPSRTIGRYLEDMVSGGTNIELSTVIKDEARFFTFVARDEDAIAVEALKLPAEARVVCLYRNGAFALADANTRLRKGDEVVILAHSKSLAALQQRWKPKQAPAD
jgi:trk system potassium uptake protein TrkA